MIQKVKSGARILCMGYFIYCRISRDATGEMPGVQRQETECREFAKANGLEILDVFVDNDISAYSGKARPSFEEMLKRLAAGQAEGIIAWHLDRLYRRTHELERIVETVEKLGIQVRTVQAGDLDLSTANGRLIARISASIASHEVEHQTERITASHRDRAMRGLWRGGIVPFGYRTSDKTGILEPDGEKAEAVRWLADEVLAGTSLFSLARRMNEKGLKRPNGAKWTHNAIRSILTAPVTGGLSVYRGEVVGKTQWPGLISEETWHAVKAYLSNPKRRTNQGAARKWQGSGLYRCGRCGGTMRMMTSRGTYSCKDCSRVSRRQDKVDETVDGVVIGYLSKPENQLRIANREHSTGDDVAKLLDERRWLVERHGQLGVMFADGQVTSAQMVAGGDRLRSRIEALDKRLEAVADVSPVVGLLGAEDVAGRWAEMSADKRVQVIDLLMVVTLLPTSSRSKFDPSSVQIELK